MLKTSLYLDSEVDRALARRAKAEGISKAELIRRSLAATLAEAPHPRPIGRGLFEAPSDFAAEADRHLADTGYGET